MKDQLADRRTYERNESDSWPDSFYFAENNQFHREFMDERKNLLRTYLDGNLEREKQALYALQYLMHRLEHPNSKFIYIFL